MAYIFSVAFEIRQTQCYTAYKANGPKSLQILGFRNNAREWCPNALLLDSDGSANHFGFEAEEVYEELTESGRFTAGLYFFKDLKQVLSNNQAQPCYVMKDVFGKEMATEKVIYAVVEALIKRFLKHVRQRAVCLDVNDLIWTIVLPTTTRESIIQLFQDSALKAGIDNTRLNVIVSSEAVIYRLNHNMAESHNTLMETGRPFMVLYIDDDTTNITVYQRMENKVFKELFFGCMTSKVSTRTELKRQCEILLEEIFGEKVITDLKRLFKDNKGEDFFDQNASNNELYISSCQAYSCLRFELFYLLEACRYNGIMDIQNALKESPSAKDIKKVLNGLRFGNDITKRMHEPVLKRIVHFVKVVLSMPKFDNIKTIYNCAENENTLIPNFLEERFSKQRFLNDKLSMYALQGALLDKNESVRVEHIPCIERFKVKKRDEENHFILSENIDLEDDDQSLASDFLEFFENISMSSCAYGGISGHGQSAIGIACLKQRVSGSIQNVKVRRSNLVEDALNLYKDLDVSRPIRVEFIGEERKEDPGLNKEMFGQFWRMVTSVWFRGENVIIPFSSNDKRLEARSVFPVIGKIIEHMLGLVGHFPAQLCRSIIMLIAHPDKDVDQALVLDDYFMYLPESESNLLQACLENTLWSDNQRSRLLRFFSVNDMSVNPSPNTLKQHLVNIAHVKLIDSCHHYAMMIRKGISDFALENFFDSLDVQGVRAMYSTMEATPEKVAQMVDDYYERTDLRRDEENVINHLSNFIRKLDKKQVRRFLVWLTGSQNMPDKIEITFNASRGIARAPVAHTCSNMLELPTAYITYQEFEREFSSILQNEDAFTLSHNTHTYKE